MFKDKNSSENTDLLNREWELIFNAVPDSIAIIDTDFRIIKVNKAMVEFLKIDAQDILGKHCYSLIHSQNEPHFLCPHEMMLKDLKPHAEEFHENNVNKDLIVSVSPIFDDGELKGSVHIVHDDTQRKQLEKTNERLADIVRHSNDAIISKDLNGIITSWNLGAEKIYGYSAQEILGKNISTLIPPGNADESFILEKIKNNQEIKNYEAQRADKNGDIIQVSINISPINDSDGNIVGASTIARDITEMHSAKIALKENEEKFREVFNNANDAFFLHKIVDGLPGKFFDVNKVACERLGYSKEELLNLGPQDINTPDIKNMMPQRMDNLQRNGKSTFESFNITKTGKIIPVEISADIFELNGEEIVFSIARDISAHIKAENDIKESERKYRKIFDNMQDVFYQIFNNGLISEISPSIYRYSGFTREELIGKQVESVYSNPDDRQILLETINQKGEISDYEVKLKNKDNELLYVSTNAHPWLDKNNNVIGIEGSLRDITERKKMENELRNVLQEKEMLLKEIHHRVKNNLMIISSLLELQSQDIQDKDDLKLFKESQARADSMALIHERLYQSTDLKHINFGEYIETLANSLFNTYVMDESLIKLDLNVENIMLDINTAIPLGLIVNELITNSMKHAFPDGHQGEIKINFTRKDDKLFLEVFDNGVGLPEDLDIRNTTSLGLQIVNSLTSQIDGDLILDTENGTSFRIIFKEEKFNT
ncbi:MAG: PAS domain S-box protein [Methanobacterium sp.]|nr:PAS domain S-box protein [Methanobacterium sp.]